MKDWYLNTPSPNITSGYESDAINDYGTSNFNDVLETDFADKAILYNSSLTESKEVKCVVQGNTADTQLSSMERTILFSIGTVTAGMYLYFDRCYWIIDGYPANNKTYEKATAKLCQYELTWQASDLNIIKRWIHLDSASKYDVGQSVTNAMILASNNYTMLIGYDEDAMELENQRVFIDRKTENPTKVFRLTRNDDVLWDYQSHGSILSFICDRTELSLEHDNQELRVCDYKVSTTPLLSVTDDISTVIHGGGVLRYDIPKTWDVEFMDKNGNNVEDYDYSWNVKADFDVNIEINENQIQLYMDDDSLVGETIILQILHDGTVASEIRISITEEF